MARARITILITVILVVVSHSFPYHFHPSLDFGSGEFATKAFPALPPISREQVWMPTTEHSEVEARRRPSLSHPTIEEVMHTYRKGCIVYPMFFNPQSIHTLIIMACIQNGRFRRVRYTDAPSFLRIRTPSPWILRSMFTQFIDNAVKRTHGDNRNIAFVCPRHNLYAFIIFVMCES